MERLLHEEGIISWEGRLFTEEILKMKKPIIQNFLVEPVEQKVLNYAAVNENNSM